MRIRSIAVLLACAFPFFDGVGRSESPDPIFGLIPFARWLAEAAPGPFRWSAKVAAAELSNHQRLRVRVELTLDGGDLVSRRGDGFMAMLIQFEDADHRVYQNHQTLDLSQVTEAAGKSNIVYTQDVFVRPGDYRVALLIFHSKTGEHGSAVKTLHVNALKNDPFPHAWEDLPAVEFVPAGEPPDNWFVPSLTGRLRLPLESRRPVRLEVLVNASPTFAQLELRTGPANSRSLIDLLPALKVISQLVPQSGSLNLSLLDLTRRRVIFEQENLRELDWPRLRSGLGEADPNKIDVRSLEHREKNAQFFVEQVRQRFLGSNTPPSPAAEEPVRVGLVLSGPMGFASGEDLRAIDSDDKSVRRIYYFRYHTLPPAQLLSPPSLDAMRGRRTPSIPPRPISLEPIDSLVPLMKPLQPRVFDIYSPEQFRKALSTMMKEISSL